MFDGDTVARKAISLGCLYKQSTKMYLKLGLLVLLDGGNFMDFLVD